MFRSLPSRFRRLKLEKGARLYFRARTGNAQAIAALNQWSHDRYDRQNAIKQFETLWENAGELAGSPEIAVWRGQALIRKKADALVSPRRLVLPIATASLILGSCLLLAYLTDQNSSELTIDSQARVRTIALSDGSTIILDRNSTVQILYSPNSRIVRLNRGQARFDVAHESKRNFDVVVAGHDVEAVGTSFNVDTHQGMLTVSLFHGQLVVRDVKKTSALFGLGHRETRANPIPLVAGQQFRLAGGRKLIGRFSLAEVSAWQEGFAIFAEAPLSSAVAVINRYASKPLRLDASVPTNLTVSGQFSVIDSEAFSANLQLLYPTLIVREQPDIIRVSAAPRAVRAVSP